MRFRIFGATSLAFVSFAVGSIQAQSAKVPVMLPGLWEITVQTRSPISGPPVTHTVCIDKEHVTKPDPPKSRPSDDCQVLPDASAGNESAYTIRCSKRNIVSTSRFTYSRDHFDGTIVITTANAEVHQVYAAKRIGDCDDDVPDQPATSTAK
jgi:hypothetical protein